ncbi:hypothetical protein FS837_003921 [Tulasnella sp. UAMH 9824]|nr:hypothetical protein FS837_003921 [Tulasnella sp. UAMH 9824]
MAGPLPTAAPSPSSFDYLQHIAPGTQPVPSPSNSNTPIPVPTQTPPPSPPRQDVLYVNPDGSSHVGQWPPESPRSNSKGKKPMNRPNVDASLRRRGLTDDSSDASDPHPSCDDVGNNILSCYPTSGTTINQGEWTKFIWNTNIPDFIGLPGKVDVYLYHADSGALVQSWPGLYNEQGQVNVVANDSFWDYRMSKWQPGQTIPYTYYFVIVKSGTQLTGGEPRQATWTAVQTAFADSVYASSSSAVSVSSVSMASWLSALGPTSASLISASMSRASASAMATSGTNGAGLQGSGQNDPNGGFPAWAIALLVILGFLAFLSMAGLGYVLIRNWRRKHRRGSGFSVDSASPMMVQAAPTDDMAQSPVSPATLQSPDHFAKSGPLAAAGAMMGAAATAPGGTRNNSIHYDGASTRSVSDAGLFSGQDAAVMADAFRRALRKPDFADRPLEEGESPDTGTNGVKNTPSSGAAQPSPSKPPATAAAAVHREPDVVISRELAEEGRDLRSVSSVKGYTVQSLEEGSAEGTTTTGTNRKSS